ncbi:MAG TPA: hypothetical protein VNW29_04755 [Candidatus Sulfotelmatobacter sp.]|jgi:hypothetical protein|nr:hypothetical protein [Candidatus Sulfotelmatobacter sp.]
MNFSSIMPQPNILAYRPQKISPHGNLYKIPIVHTNENGTNTNNYEVWTTKEAVQQHFDGMTEEPKNYQLKKFARQIYEKQLRSSNGQLGHKGILITTTDVTHGNPHLWPNTISHPEVKI